MDVVDIKKVAFSGIIWQLTSRIGTNGIQFLIFLILARLLQPEDFGIIAIVSVFINISNILVNSGLGTALVQAKDVDETDYSSVLYMSFIIASIFYAIIYLGAPYIAAFYHQEALVGVLRTYAISILFFAINGVQTSILLRKLEFKKIFLLSSIPVVISGLLSVSMAYSGFGVYALVANALTSGLLNVILFGIILKWIPKRVFSLIRIKELFSFSYKLLFASIIEEAYKSLYPLIIGRVCSTTMLGYYNNGRQIPNLIVSTINASIASVAFPIYSRNQDDNFRLKAMVRHSITLGNFIIFPLMAGLAAIAEPLVTLMLTEKWLLSVPFLQLFCIVSGLYHIQSVNFHAISAIGKSQVFLKYEAIKKIIGLVLLLITVPFGIKALVYSQVILAIIYILINFKPNIIWLGYSIKEQLNDIWPYLLASLTMFVGIRLLNLIELNLWVKLFMEIFIGISIYFMMAKILKLSGFITLKEILKKTF